MLGVLILTYNEEVNLPDCLESLVDLDASIFVLDSGSADATLEIARGAGAVMFAHPFKDYASQRNVGQQMLPEHIDWVLHLDADERLTPELVREINGLGIGATNVDGFLFRKRTYFMGRWIRHGGHYPSFHLRLFRRGLGRCEDRHYDQHFMVDGTVKTLSNDYIDVVATDLTSWSARHLKWANAEVEELLNPTSGENRVQPRFFGNGIERRRWLRERVLYHSPPMLRAFLYFLYRYLLRRGFLDGKEGLVFHFLQGLWFRFLIDALLYERTRHTPRNAE